MTLPRQGRRNRAPPPNTSVPPLAPDHSGLSFSLSIGLSLCANIASAPELNAFSIAVAACPPLALLLSVELLNQALKRRRTEAARDTVHGSEQPRTGPPLVDEPPEGHQGPTGAANEQVPGIASAANNAAGDTTSTDDAVPEPANGDDPLHEEAYRLDAEHWDRHHRPISADTLRRKLSIGSQRARALTRHLRQHHRPETQPATGK